MKEFFINHQSELLGTLITLVVLLIIRFLAVNTIVTIGKRSDLNQVRTKLMVKYVSIGLSSLAIIALVFIWGVNIRELGLIMSSIFAVLGVALFAQWSILSNVTAGVILFLSFPYKIGDRIKILDKELELEMEYTIEDIKLYYVILRNTKGDLITYPNNLIMQKAVAIIATAKEELQAHNV